MIKKYAEDYFSPYFDVILTTVTS